VVCPVLSGTVAAKTMVEAEQKMTRAEMRATMVFMVLDSFCSVMLWILQQIPLSQF
jgi:hypothetical protein